jgi:hypothetical protein
MFMKLRKDTFSYKLCNYIVFSVDNEVQYNIYMRSIMQTREQNEHLRATA